MKMVRCIVGVMIVSSFFCAKNISTNAKSNDAVTEENAIEKITVDISDKKDVLKGKKIGIFNFSNLEGKETNDGKRLAKKLQELLLKKGGLVFVERAELDKLLNAQGLEQTGIVESEAIAESGKVLPIDVMINGTLAQIQGNGELTVKGVHVSSGEIYFMSSVTFTPQEAFTYKENTEKLQLHKKSPDTLDIINRTYLVLNTLSARKPLVFLLAVCEKDDPIFNDTPQLGKKLMMINAKMKNDNPMQWKRLTQLRRGVALLKQYDVTRYNDIQNKKMIVIKKSKERKGMK